MVWPHNGVSSTCFCARNAVSPVFSIVRLAMHTAGDQEPW